MAELDDENLEDEEGQEKSGDKGKKKMLFIIGGAVLLLLGIGTPVAFMLLKSDSQEMGHADGDEAKLNETIVIEGFEDEDEFEEDEEPLGAIYPLDTFVVNLRGGGYLRMQAQVEFGKRTIPRKFHARLVLIRDALISLLTQKKRSDISGETGKKNLKEDIRQVINEALRREEAKAVYFTQFVLQ